MSRDLFDDVPPYQRHSVTSRAAAAEILPKAGTLRRLVYDYIFTAGEYGRTDEEAQVYLRLNPSTQRPRRIELVNAGLVRDSGRTRPTRSGRQATVWVATTYPGWDTAP